MGQTGWPETSVANYQSTLDEIPEEKSQSRSKSGSWISVCCECCVLSGRGLCDELITHPEESYRLWCAVVCDLETSGMSTQNEQAEPLVDACNKST